MTVNSFDAALDPDVESDNDSEQIILTATQTLVEIKFVISTLEPGITATLMASQRDLILTQIDDTLELIRNSFLQHRGIKMHQGNLQETIMLASHARISEESTPLPSRSAYGCKIAPPLGDHND